MLAQNRNDLLFREPATLHRPSLQPGRTLIPRGGKTQWQVTSDRKAWGTKTGINRCLISFRYERFGGLHGTLTTIRTTVRVRHDGLAIPRWRCRACDALRRSIRSLVFC